MSTVAVRKQGNPVGVTFPTEVRIRARLEVGIKAIRPTIDAVGHVRALIARRIDEASFAERLRKSASAP